MIAPVVVGLVASVLLYVVFAALPGPAIARTEGRSRMSALVLLAVAVAGIEAVRGIVLRGIRRPD